MHTFCKTCATAGASGCKCPLAGGCLLGRILIVNSNLHRNMSNNLKGTEAENYENLKRSSTTMFNQLQ